MKKLCLLAALLALVKAGLPAEPVTLEETRALALANSRELAKYNLAVQSAALDEKTRIYGNLPSPSLSAGASMTLWSAAGGEPAENPFDTFSARAGVSVSQKVFEGGKSAIQKAINEIASESARKDALAEYFRVLETADSAYYAVLEARDALLAAESSLQSVSANLDIAEIRLSSGMINQGDYLKALSEKETMENTRNQARRTLSLNTAKLKSLAGVNAALEPEPVDFTGQETLIEHLARLSDGEADALYLKFRELLSAANPALAKAALANRRAEKNLDLTKKAYLPSVSASFSTGLNYTLQGGLELSSGGVSLSANIPVDFWVLSANVKKSEIARKSAALDYVSAESNLDTELQSALIGLFDSAGSALSSGRALEYAEKHYEFVSERYRLSQSSISELGEASALLINNRNSRIRARYEFMRNLSKLRSLGALDTEEKLAGLLMGN